VIVGIDMAKAVVDVAVAVRPSGQPRQVANAAAGIAAVVQWRELVRPPLLVREATRGDARR
jgi:transposase